MKNGWIARIAGWRQQHEADIAENVKICGVVDDLRRQIAALLAERDGYIEGHRKTEAALQDQIAALTAERDALKPLIDVAESRRQEILKLDERLAAEAVKEAE